MKPFLKVFFLLLLFTSISVSADEPITRWEALIYLADKVDDNLPESYKYIDLYYTWVEESSVEGRALQKLVYLGLIKNSKSNLWLDKNINLQLFEALVIKVLNLKIDSNISAIQKRNTLVKESDIFTLESLIFEISESQNVNSSPESISGKSKILSDVYETLNESHYDRNNFNEDQLITGAIKWAAESIWDKYTTYFPPVESKNFNEGLDGSFEWIWAYIDMTTPWELIIISPIVGWPAENAGIKWWDRVISVDWKEITPENSVNEVVSWIKWPKWSTVEITIKREDLESFTLTVTRDTIIIKDVEHEKLSGDTYYIQIKSFWNNVTTEFKQALEVVQADSWINKVIFDLRNNPGWYLDEVSYMLSYFIPEGKVTAIIDYGSSKKEFISRWYDLLDSNKYEFVFLQNWGSASASEIMIWTMKDYYPEMTIIWEKSFWKWSVQSLKNYYDGSTLKYTTAKWFTGKTRTGIDSVGITPDVFIELDIESLKNNEYDNQLERAKSN